MTLDEALESILSKNKDISKDEYGDLMQEILDNPHLQEHLVQATVRTFTQLINDPTIVRYFLDTSAILALGICIGRRQYTDFKIGVAEEKENEIC